MIIKIAIIGVILVAGGLIFSSEINGIFPSTIGSIAESLKNNANSAATDTADSLKESLDTSVNNVGKQLDESLNKATQSSNEFISNTVPDINPTEQIGGIIKNTVSSGFGSGGSDSSTQYTNTDYSSNESETESAPHPTPTNDQNLVYETLSLSTTQQSDENILLQYHDSSDKTQSVSVIIKNSEQEIFSGKFYSSMFETIVNDASNMPYQIDMLVEHQEYGLVASSVYNPGDSSDSQINGIFTQS